MATNKLIEATILRDSNGTFLTLSRDRRFEQCLAGLRLKDSQCGFKFYEMPSSSAEQNAMGDDLRAWFGQFRNAFNSSPAGYSVLTDGYRNFGILRVKTDGNEVRVPLQAASEETLRTWVNELIRLHKEWYMKFLKKFQVELTLMETEVV